MKLPHLRHLAFAFPLAALVPVGAAADVTGAAGLSGAVHQAVHRLSDPAEGTAVWLSEGAACESCASRRDVFVDYAALGIGAGGEWIAYDYDEVTHPTTARGLYAESDLSNAVRLIISESGADRVLVNRNALWESVGILYTVENRMTPTVYNPEDHLNAPDYVGCDGPGGSWVKCANAPGHYLGMFTWRALNPQVRYPAAMLENAVDVAVTAFYLQRNHLVGDPTGGATNYVHRCGGAAYGMPTWACDGHMGHPERDVAGANPYTGPILFKAPNQFLRGGYDLFPSSQLDYEPLVDVFQVDSDALADLGEGQLAVTDPPEIVP